MEDQAEESTQAELERRGTWHLRHFVLATCCAQSRLGVKVMPSRVFFTHNTSIKHCSTGCSCSAPHVVRSRGGRISDRPNVQTAYVCLGDFSHKLGEQVKRRTLRAARGTLADMSSGPLCGCEIRQISYLSQIRRQAYASWTPSASV